jgi:hypothetical protein
MKRLSSIFLIFALIFLGGNLFGQYKQTYKSNGTTYVYGETYSTTGRPKVERSSSTRTEFLKSEGYDKVPSGYQVDHKVPLSKGGADQPYNMQLISTEQHKAKTANEKTDNSINSTYVAPKYKSTSTYKGKESYSAPSYSNTSNKTFYSGLRGGQYYINSNGNKSYVKKK